MKEQKKEEPKKLSYLDMLIHAFEVAEEIVYVDYFSNEAEAEQFVLKELKKRYKKEFEILPNTTGYERFSTSGKELRYVGSVAPKNKMTQEFLVLAKSHVPAILRIEDDYHIYLFKDRLHTEVKKIVDTIDQSGILKYEIKFQGRETFQKWTGKEPLEDYRTSGLFETWIYVTVAKETPDTEHMKTIRIWVAALLKAVDYNYTLRFYTDNSEYKERIYHEDLNQYKDFSVDLLTDKLLESDFQSNRFDGQQGFSDNIYFAND